MRYYSIAIAGAPGAFPARYDGGAQWGTEVNGKHDPGAQQIEFQIEEFRPDLPSSDSTLTIHGVSFDQIKETGGLIGLPITIYGGMRPGLPLATQQARKAGLLMEGQIKKAWGNWVGTEMSIGLQFAPAGTSDASSGNGGGNGGGAAQQAIGAVESAIGGGGGGSAGGQMVRARKTGFRSIDRRPYARGAIAPLGSDTPMVSPTGLGDIGEFGGGSVGAATSFAGGLASSFFGGGSNGLEAPLNLIHNMMPNMSMSSAIQETLGKAFPRGGANVAISPGLKLPYQDAGMYQNMQQYAGFIKNLSNSILGIKNYKGVNMSAHTNTMNVWDGTQPLGEGQIDIFDLIGQPTWIDYMKINIKTILRGDIHCGWYVTLPPTLIALSPGAIIPFMKSDQRTNVSLPGTFLVWRILHIGDFRNPDGVGWSTNFECFYQSATTGQNEAAQQTQDSNQNQNPNNAPVSEEPPLNPIEQTPVQ
jgi:hypothetical protein